MRTTSRRVQDAGDLFGGLGGRVLGFRVEMGLGLRWVKVLGDLRLPLLVIRSIVICSFGVW